jgi:hypothetical protein
MVVARRGAGSNQGLGGLLLLLLGVLLLLVAHLQLDGVDLDIYVYLVTV